MDSKKRTTIMQAVPTERIERLIYLIRGQRVILGADLAVLYGVVTWRLHEQVKRNQARFPDDFVFQLTPEENQTLTSRFARSKPGRGGRRTLPYSFTEHGAIMAAMVLNSPSPPVPSPFEGGREHLTWTPPPIAGEDEGGGDFLRNERPSRPGLCSTSGHVGNEQGAG